MTTRCNILACCRDAAAAAPGISPPCFLPVPGDPQFGFGPVVAVLDEPPPWDVASS